MNITPEMLNYGQFDGDIALIYCVLGLLIILICGSLLFKCLETWEKYKKKHKLKK